MLRELIRRTFYWSALVGLFVATLWSISLAQKSGVQRSPLVERLTSELNLSPKQQVRLKSRIKAHKPNLDRINKQISAVYKRGASVRGSGQTSIKTFRLSPAQEERIGELRVKLNQARKNLHHDISTRVLNMKQAEKFKYMGVGQSPRRPSPVRSGY